MENNSTVRTMEYIGLDDWNRPVYKCIETGSLWKDITLGKGVPELFSCGNIFDGEPCSPIKSDLTVVFKTKYEESPYRFNYMMLGRLRSDCDYYLGYGNRNKSRLSGEDEKNHIEEMKSIYNSIDEKSKPEWLTWEQILEYERQMMGTGE
ncbi:LPD11 domain-containing protein [Brevibacillus reuszeri]|uniref:LPD11 domain-containing protein n=1 Tax=Brevibacillus reuszeri TaxID=54915 RepID=UPI000CCC2E03|nr:LPD11 domain-containing protein [Brevibacillus reuszeri]